MVRPRRMTLDDFFAPLGDIAMVALVLPTAAVLLVSAGVLILLEWAHSKRRLGPFAFGVLLGAVVLHLAGCAAAPAPATPGNMDPAVWRPSTPAQYPLPR